jgi:hypothetical protein
MKITTENKTITSMDFSNTETAWMIEDAFFLLDDFKIKKKIVLGGDILTEKLEYNYDSWYYNMDSSQNSEYNVECSIKVAFEYISNYIRANGNSFYVIFVTE